MHWDWIIAGVQGGLVLLGVGLCLFLFFSLKREMRLAETRSEEAGRMVEACLRSLKAEAESLRSGLQSLEDRSGAWSGPAFSPPELHLTRRAQALRMHRRGEQPHQIAASLGLPIGEVDLLLKVHRMTAEKA